MNLKNQKPKWLIAFALSLVCLMLCASLLAAPTLAAVDAAAVRDAYYNALDDTVLKTAGSATTGSNLDYPLAASFKTGVASVIFTDLDKDGTEEMLVLETSAPTTAAAPGTDPVYSVYLSVYNYKDSKVNLVRKENIGSFGGAQTEESLAVFNKETDGKRYVGVEKSITTTETAYTLTLFSYAENAVSVAARFSGERGTGDSILVPKADGDSDILYAFDGTDIFTLARAAGASKISIADLTDWLKQKNTHTSTTTTTTTAAPAVVPLSSVTMAAKSDWNGPGKYTDAKGAEHEGSYQAWTSSALAGAIAYGQFNLNKQYAKITGTLAADTGNAADASIVVKFYADDNTTPFYTSPAVTKAGEPVSFDESVAGIGQLKIEVSNSAAKGPAFVILANAKLMEASGTTITTTAPSEPYKLVTGYAALYEALDASGNPKNPKEYVWGYSKSTGKYVFKAYENGGKYYAPMLDTGIYIAIKGGATIDSFDLTDAIWHGEDKIFGTADDVAASLKNDGSFYYSVMENGELVWRYIADLVQGWPESLFPGATTTSGLNGSSSTSAPDGLSSSTSPFFNGGNGYGPPKTGVELNAGVAFAMVILLMGCGYSGYRFFRKEKE